MMGLSSNPTECRREAEVVSAVHAAEWPPAEGSELAAHFARCLACNEVAAVASSFDAERRSANRVVSVPSAARVYWRAQMRARLEATEAASQPLTIAQGVAAICVGALVLLSIRWGWPSTPAVGGWLARFAGDATATLGLVDSGILQLGLWLTLGLAALVLVPVVVFYALPEE
jgi:hypothetical protein